MQRLLSLVAGAEVLAGCVLLAVGLFRLRAGSEAELWLQPRRLSDLRAWSNAELLGALAAIQEEQVARVAAAAPPDFGASAGQQAHFLYAHKHTYATGDPKAAAYFMARYFGGWCNHEPGHGFQRHHCTDHELEQPMTWNAYYSKTKEQPLGFSIHFVKNPHKLPRAPMNSSELGLWVERWRGNFSATGRFDQFMDNHLGLVFDTLDPLVVIGNVTACRSSAARGVVAQGCPSGRSNARTVRVTTNFSVSRAATSRFRTVSSLRLCAAWKATTLLDSALHLLTTT
eukprot:CAMPEP_0179084422 /NCGR_PEP_ID=MMETSP0796-20121207/38179_1 /TAXON_ID=73915 /ORGANISM="Pyrodinium bahamense, Strain pbaha01" /LENGTH=284 /DNA_ID=CAMNT_0020781847 /DNA_START=57 /DNA_END=912 /DNA_ORIENTATION=-